LFFLISNIFLNFEHGFIYTGLLDPLLLYLKLSFFFSLVFTLPFFIYLFIFFFFRSFSNFLTIYYFFYIFSLYSLVISLFILLVTLIFPVLFEFLLNFQRTNTLETLELILQATINQYYNFFFSYIKIYLLLIFIPNLFFCLILLNFFKKQIFLNFKFRKYLYLIVFLVFLIFAPPDFFLQLLIFPLIIFILEIFIYFISYLLILYYLF
jgi:Sec-independent protein secretion pathway component TatC